MAMLKEKKEMYERDLNDGYVGLANAIAARAYKDYVELPFSSYSLIVTYDGKIDYTVNNFNAPVSKREILNYFDSELFSNTSNIDKDAILAMAENEIRIIKESIADGLTHEQLILTHMHDRISIDAHDYKRIAKNYREKELLKKIIAAFEQ